MSNMDRLAYGVCLFLALAVLAMWKRRRETTAARMKRVLTGYVSSQTAGIEPTESQFGLKARVPLVEGKFDRTEVDLRIGNLLVEAKLTEADFQSKPKSFVNRYGDFEKVFRRSELPQSKAAYGAYQLIRNVLAAYALDCSFCVMLDARRPDLIEQWYAVMRAVKVANLRLRCKVLTWQELSEALPPELCEFLDEKYGIRPGPVTPYEFEHLREPHPIER